MIELVAKIEELKVVGEIGQINLNLKATGTATASEHEYCARVLEAIKKSMDEWHREKYGQPPLTSSLTLIAREIPKDP